jgi:hypothetical protein
MSIRYEIRKPVSTLEFELLQSLDADGVCVRTAPVRINGTWFLPATAGQTDQIEAEWLGGASEEVLVL